MTTLPPDVQAVYNDLQNSAVFYTQPLNHVTNAATNMGLVYTFLANSMVDPSILNRVTNLLDSRDGAFAIVGQHLNFQYSNLTRNASIYTTAESINESFGSQTMEGTINVSNSYFGSILGTLEPYLDNIDNSITYILGSGDPNTGVTEIESNGTIMVNITESEVQIFVNSIGNSINISETTNLLVLCSDPSMAPIIGTIAENSLANAVISLSANAGVYAGLPPFDWSNTQVSVDTTPWYPNDR
jgi:hypothetical protein